MLHNRQSEIGLLPWLMLLGLFAEIAIPSAANAQNFFPFLRRYMVERGPKTLLQWSNAKGDETEGEAAFYGDRIITDRPHFAEAASLVGLGRVQVETGYTYFGDGDDGTTIVRQSFPEPLVRIGMFREWFEFRFAYNYLNQQTNDATGSAFLTGSDDITIGAKIALAEQSGILPELTIFPQMIVPAGHPDFTAGRVLPDVNFAYAWEITERLELECNTRVFGRREPAFDHSYVEIRQFANFEYNLSERYMLFNEFFVISPCGAFAAPIQYYYHPGLHYFIMPSLQLDFHVAVGLNRDAIDFFGGSGLSWRW